jgi:hypothetical protein
MTPSGGPGYDQHQLAVHNGLGFEAFVLDHANHEPKVKLPIQ